MAIDTHMADDDLGYGPSVAELLIQRAKLVGRLGEVTRMLEARRTLEDEAVAIRRAVNSLDVELRQIGYPKSPSA